MDPTTSILKPDGSDWDEQVRAVLPRVYRYFAYRLGEGSAAEDLTGETFERAWRGRLRYRPDRGEWADWLFGIARNVAADHLRRLYARRDALPDPPAPLGRPTEDDFDRRAEFGRLNDLLAGLGPRERELISLKYGAELTNRAIARLMGLSETNVGTILHRVVQALRREWERGS
jgi:RNA polymerase sigma-70 factor (ECF subfamily)